MKKFILASSTALLAFTGPAFAQDHAQPTQDMDRLPADTVLDRLNQLEARIRQLEARNAQLEAAAAETQTRVQNVEVRAAKAVRPGAAPTFSDVNGQFTFKPRGTLQVDYAGFNERAGGYDYSNGTDIRRARFGFDGTFLTNFKYRIEAEYVKGVVNLLDAYIQYAASPKWTLTVGQHKAPYGLEANTSDSFNSFLERGMANNAFGAVGAERRVGISASYSSDHLNAAFGAFGSAEGVQRNGTTPDEGYGFNGRVVWEPIIDTDKLVHVGVSAFHATNFAANTLSNIGDRPNTRVDGGQIVSATITGTATTGAKSANFIGAESALVYGPFSLQGEYGRLGVNRLANAADVTFDGFYVFGSWFVTGESRAFKGGSADRIKPFADFNPGEGKWGALELLARYDQLDLTDTDLSPLDKKATSWTGGINWYLNPNLKVMFNYIRFKGENSPLYVLTTPVAGAGERTAKGEAFATRLHVDF